MKTIILSIGHDWGKNGNSIDTGANANGTNEPNETNHVVDGVIAKGIPGITLVKVPLSLNLQQRIDWINANYSKYPEPIALEFHLDAGPNTARGASVWYAAGNTFTQTEGGQFLQAYTQVTGEPSRHVNPDTADRLGRLGFDHLKCASFLVELGFITNPQDLQSIRAKAIDGVIAGIINMNSK